MKGFNLVFSQRMVAVMLVISVALPPCIGLAQEQRLELSSHYNQALQLLTNNKNRTEAESKYYFSDITDYGRKKLEYYRFLDEYIKDKRQELAAEGVSVSVVSKNDLLFIKGYGYADRESKTHVNPFTLFAIGSVSKLFTGIAIMQLVEQGRVDLDAPLENYIPGFGYKSHFPYKDPITVRSLMTHQSGLVGEILKGSASVLEPEHDFRELVDYFNNEYVAYPPRYISTYSNSAVALLGIVIEEVSGVEFETYVKNNICRPIGMLASNFSLRDYMRPMLAKSYDSEGVEAPFSYIRDVPAGSFISNSLEMSLFIRMILNGGELFGRRILKESTLEQMFDPQNSDIELDFPLDHGQKWGLSWMLSQPALSYAGKYVGHSGATSKYYTQLHILPEHGLAVIVETNSQTALSEVVADMAMIKALEIFEGIERPTPAALPSQVPLTQDHIQQATGNYATNHLGLLSIHPNNHSLFAVSSVLGDIELELKPHADNWFSLYLNNQVAPGFENIRITVKNGEHERFVGIQFHNANGVILSVPEGSEYEIPEEIPAEWMKRVGWYRIINPSSDISEYPDISIHLLSSGVLSYTVSRHSSNVLDAIYEDEAIRSGRGRGLNETVQVVDCDGEPCLYHLGYLLRKQADITPSTYSQKVAGAHDLKKKGKEIEKRLIQAFRLPDVNY